MHGIIAERQRRKFMGRRAFPSRTTKQSLKRHQEQKIFAVIFIFVSALLLLVLRPPSNPLPEQQFLTSLSNAKESELGKDSSVDSGDVSSHADSSLPQNNNITAEDEDKSSSPATNIDATQITQKAKLRFYWANLELKSDFAKQLYANQHNCSLPVVLDEWRISPLHKLNYGLGSDLHVYGTHLSIAVEQRQRLRSTGKWAWLDKDACEEQHTKGSRSLSCYLTNVEPLCGDEEEEVVEKKRAPFPPCLSGVLGIDDKVQVERNRASITEYMFSSVSKVVIDEAERQLNLVFPGGNVPIDLICVHVRWGDKSHEMQLVEMKKYIQAVEKIVKEANLTDVHILLCTEDPEAVAAFRKQMPGHWNVYLDHFYTMYLPYRENRNATYSITTQISMETNGKPGLWAMASVLVAMEANYFVLTTKSNWSRILNELRKAVVDPRCDGCTKLVDLRSGEC